MPLDRAILETKLEGLKDQRQKLFDQANAVTGAIQFTLQLLDELNQELQPHLAELEKE